MSRRAARLDRNHWEIKTAIERCGVCCVSAAGMGDGFPDLICATQRVMWLCEVKDGKLSPSKQALTPDQVAFHESWPQRVWIINDVSQVPQMVAEMTRWTR